MGHAMFATLILCVASQCVCGDVCQEERATFLGAVMYTCILWLYTWLHVGLGARVGSGLFPSKWDLPSPE